MYLVYASNVCLQIAFHKHIEESIGFCGQDGVEDLRFFDLKRFLVLVCYSRGSLTSAQSTCSCAGHTQKRDFAATASDVVSFTALTLLSKLPQVRVIWRRKAQRDYQYFKSYALEVVRAICPHDRNERK